MTLLETRNLPNFKMFYRPPEGPTYYWDDSGMLCGSDGKSVKVTKNLLAEQYIISCDHKCYFPVGQGASWHLKCADCLCDLEVVSIREMVKMPDNRPPNPPPLATMKDNPMVGWKKINDAYSTAESMVADIHTSMARGATANSVSDVKTNVMPCL